MHTIMVIAGGLGLLAASLAAGHWFGGENGLKSAPKIFLALWLAASLVNMWVGVTRAGYTVAQELPMLLIVFGVPAACAGFALWKFSRA
jgi:hypothetical protein